MRLDYDIGDTVVLVMDFAGNDGAADPSEFTVTVRAPDGTETIYTQTDATNDPALTGRFTLLVPATQVGRWKAIVAATAGVVAAEPHEWGVRQSPFAFSRDLCALADVVRYVPAYTIGDNEAIDAKLQDLITAQSEQIMAETTREIVGQDEGPRDYTIDRPAAATGRVRIGDLSTLTGTTITLINRDGTTAETITASQVVPLYGADLAPTAGWEPITCLELRTDLGAPTLTAGQTLRLAGPFGFPSIPPFVREACAARVIGRYLADVATTGDEFTQALDTVNFGGLFGNAEDALRTITPVVAA